MTTDEGRAVYGTLADYFGANANAAGLSYGYAGMSGLALGMTIALRDPSTAVLWLAFSDRLIAALGNEVAEQTEISRIEAAAHIAEGVRRMLVP